MKIAQIAPPWIAIPPKNYGGTETVIHSLTEEQVSQGHDVTLIASGDSQTKARLISFLPRSLTEEGVPWTAHQKAYYHLHKAIEYVKQHNFDIVHTHLSSGADMFLFPLLAKLNIPHITTLHSNIPFAEEETPELISNDCMAEWAPHVPIVAISESAQKQQGLPLNFIGIAHHGILLDEYVNCYTEHDDYFLWLGRFSPEKGAHLAIEAAKQAQVPLILAGTIDHKNKQTEAYFHEQIEPQIDNQHIRYVGPADLEHKVKLMGRARGFLNPIEWEEPFGMVMIEAMALGCPVISFARGAAPELIIQGKTGFLVEDLTEMVEAIPRIDTVDRAEICVHIKREFSVTAMARRYEQIYQRARLLHHKQLIPPVQNKRLPTWRNS